MPTFYTDPSIAYRTAEAFDPFRAFGRYEQLLALREGRKYRKIQEEEAGLRLEEAKREIARRKAREDAVRGALTGGNAGALAGLAPGVAPSVPGMPAGAAPSLAPLTNVPMTPTPVAGAGGPAGIGGIDRAALLQNPELLQADPMGVLNLQQGFSLQDAELRRISAQTEAAQRQAEKALQDLTEGKSEEKRRQTLFEAEILGRLAGSVVGLAPAARAQGYQGVVAFAEMKGIPKGTFPPQYSPELDPHLEQMRLMGLSAKEQLDAEEKKEETKIKRVGVTEPFPADVEAQKARHARAGRAAPATAEQEGLTAGQKRMLDAIDRKYEYRLAPFVNELKQYGEFETPERQAEYDKLVSAYEGEIQRVMGQGQAPPGGDRVRVRAPNGEMGTIPRSQLPQAIKEGYTEIK